VEGIAGMMLEALKIHGGFLPLHDKSDPEEIRALFNISKKAFKQAIGALYRQKLISIEESGIRLTGKTPE
jgi:predicted RNA-binding protein (virulence factor B family)